MSPDHDRDDGHDLDPAPMCQPEEALPAVEHDLVALPPGSQRLHVSTRVDKYVGALAQDVRSGRLPGLHHPELTGEIADHGMRTTTSCASATSGRPSTVK